MFPIGKRTFCVEKVECQFILKLILYLCLHKSSIQEEQH